MAFVASYTQNVSLEGNDSADQLKSWYTDPAVFYHNKLSVEEISARIAANKYKNPKEKYVSPVYENIQTSGDQVAVHVRLTRQTPPDTTHVLYVLEGATTAASDEPRYRIKQVCTMDNLASQNCPPPQA